MGRPVYPHELVDPDFSWLISNFKEKRPSCSIVEVALLPVVFFETPEFEETNFGTRQPALPAPKDPAKAMIED